jgi:Protein of unknown function (DUF2281)
MKIEVLHFVQFLKTERAKTFVSKSKRKAGGLKGKIQIAPDFKVPLDDLREYM